MLGIVKIIATPHSKLVLVIRNLMLHPSLINASRKKINARHITTLMLPRPLINAPP